MLLYVAFYFDILMRLSMGFPRVLKSCKCGVSKYHDQIVGRRQHAGERIIGGYESPPNAFPWMVRLEKGCASNI